MLLEFADGIYKVSTHGSCTCLRQSFSLLHLLSKRPVDLVISPDNSPRQKSLNDMSCYFSLDQTQWEAFPAP